MSLRNTFNRRSTTSLVRREALWDAVFLMCRVFPARVATANQMCSDLQTGNYAIDLDKCRPAPIGAGEKTIVLKSLPSGDEITKLTKSERRKLKDLTAVLHLHQRDGVYELKVISVPQAWIGLYGRAALLISLPALELLGSEELQALIAHEIGHEYFWQEYAAARKDKNIARLRELELKCDAIAVLTLERIGVKPDRLIARLEKVSWYNRERLGWATNESSYPSLRARRDLVEAMSGTNSQIQIAVYDAAEVGPKTLSVAENLTGKILLAAGVDTKWRSGPISDLQRLGTDFAARTPGECAGGSSPELLRVWIIAHAPVGLTQHALGFSLPCATTGIQVTIYADRVAKVERDNRPDIQSRLGVRYGA